MERLAKKEPKTVIQRFLKLGEECGELAQEIGIAENVSGYSYKTAGKDGIHGECMDIAQTALSIFFATGGTTEEFKRFFTEKMVKWESKMEIPPKKLP